VATVKSLLALILLALSLMAHHKLVDCENYQMKRTPCYTVDEGYKRIVLSYHPYRYMNLGKVR